MGPVLACSPQRGAELILSSTSERRKRDTHVALPNEWEREEGVAPCATGVGGGLVDPDTPRSVRAAGTFAASRR